MKLTPKLCEKCFKKFKPGVWWQKYCSPECKNQAAQARWRERAQAALNLQKEKQ